MPPGPEPDRATRVSEDPRLSALPARVTVVVEVTRGSFLKRDGAGDVEYASPIPCPFNYGSVPGTVAPDGDALDALVLGGSVPRGTSVEAEVLGVVRFLDAGEVDDKLVCATGPADDTERARVRRFFVVYTWVKRAVNVVRRKRGPTRFGGVDWRDDASARRAGPPSR